MTLKFRVSTTNIFSKKQLRVKQVTKIKQL